MEQTIDNVNTLIAAYIPDNAASKITDADRKFIHAHLSGTLIEHENLRLNGIPITVCNLFTGAVIETTPLIAALVRMVTDISYSEFGPNTLTRYGLTPGNALKKFDRARYLTQKLDSNVYMQMLD